MICRPTFCSGLRSRLSSALCARIKATPPPGTIPSSTAAGGVDRVVDAVLALLQLHLAGRTHLDDRDAAGELGQALLELLPVVVAGRLLDLPADRLDAAVDLLLLACTADDRGVLLLDGDALGLAEIVDRHVLELDAQLLAHDLPAREDGHVLEHLLAAVAETGGLDGTDLERATELVDDERRERLALDVLRDDEQRLLVARNRLEDRHQVLHGRDLLLAEEQVTVVELGVHLLRVRHEVRRQVTSVELHPLDDVQLGGETLRLVDRDDAFVADLLHRLGNHLPDRLVVVGADGTDLRDLVVVLDLLRDLLELRAHRIDGCVDPALDLHRVVPGRDHARALAVDRLGEDRGRGRSVTRHVVRLRGDFAHHLGAHVLELVLELDLLGHRHAVLGDLRGTEALLQDDVATLGTERDLHRIRQRIDAGQDPLLSVVVVGDLLRGHLSPLLSCRDGSPAVRPTRAARRDNHATAEVNRGPCVSAGLGVAFVPTRR